MLSQLLDFILPRSCLICQMMGTDLCQDCQNKLMKADDGPLCIICGKPFVAASIESHPCSQCSESIPFYDKHRSIFIFDENVKRLIHQFKYQGRLGLKRVLPKYFKEISNTFSCVDMVLPIPLHDQRLRSRGFNQSLELARIIGGIVNKKVYPYVLKRVVDTPSQTGFDKKERQKNLKGALRITSEELVCKKNILLVDDVHTTGVTLNTASQILKKAGAEKVYAISLAFVVSQLGDVFIRED